VISRSGLKVGGSGLRVRDAVCKLGVWLELNERFIV
jgi:hypothetical protein